MMYASFKFATKIGTLSNACGILSTKFCFDSNPNPSGRDIETAGKASSVFAITAVALLHLRFIMIVEGDYHMESDTFSQHQTYTGVNGSCPSAAIFLK